MGYIFAAVSLRLDSLPRDVFVSPVKTGPPRQVYAKLVGGTRRVGYISAGVILRPDCLPRFIVASKQDPKARVGPGKAGSAGPCAPSGAPDVTRDTSAGFKDSLMSQDPPGILRMYIR